MILAVSFDFLVYIIWIYWICHWCCGFEAELVQLNWRNFKFGFEESVFSNDYLDLWIWLRSYEYVRCRSLYNLKLLDRYWCGGIEEVSRLGYPSVENSIELKKPKILDLKCLKNLCFCNGDLDLRLSGVSCNNE